MMDAIGPAVDAAFVFLGVLLVGMWLVGKWMEGRLR